MNITIEFNNPFDPKEKIVEQVIFPYITKHKKHFWNCLLKSSEKGMVILPIDMHINGQKISFFVASLTDKSGYGLTINPPPPPSYSMNKIKVECKQEVRKPLWKRIVETIFIGSES